MGLWHLPGCSGPLAKINKGCRTEMRVGGRSGQGAYCGDGTVPFGSVVKVDGRTVQIGVRIPDRLIRRATGQSISDRVGAAARRPYAEYSTISFSTFIR